MMYSLFESDVQRLVEALRGLLRREGHDLIEIKDKQTLLRLARAGILRAR